MRRVSIVLGVGLAVSMCGAAVAGDLFENFDDPLGDWETGWLYVNSNMGNYYNASGTSDDPNFRGNNPEGLWIADTQEFGSGVGGDADIMFNDAFAATLASISFGGEYFNNPTTVTIYDMDGAILASESFAGGGGFDFDHVDVISATSTNGIKRILFHADGSVEGATSVDNFHATLVPGPGALALLGVAGGLVARRRRRN